MRTDPWAGVAGQMENAAGLIQQDRVIADRSETAAGRRSFMRLDKIVDRKVSTRDINEEHVTALVDSISDVGLLQPVVIDERANLLAGGHRLAALRALYLNHRDIFDQRFPDGVPVRVMDMSQSPDREKDALAIEIVENEKRRDYTRDEISQLVKRLESHGYVYGQGRLKDGQKPMGPTLALILGKNLRTISRIMAEPKEAPGGKEVAFKALRRIKTDIELYMEHYPDAPENRTEASLHSALSKVLKRLREADHKSA